MRSQRWAEAQHAGKGSLGTVFQGKEKSWRGGKGPGQMNLSLNPSLTTQ